MPRRTTRQCCAELPGLLAGLSEAQLTHWQQVVDYYAVDRHIQREITALNGEFLVRAGPLYQASGDYQVQRKRLDRARPKMPEGVRRVGRRPRNAEERSEAARQYWAAKTGRERAHDEYMSLPEEVPWRVGREAQSAFGSGSPWSARSERSAPRSSRPTGDWS